jgi:hypothetical protein
MWVLYYGDLPLSLSQKKLSQTVGVSLRTPWQHHLIILLHPSLVCVHPSIELEYHLFELEECLWSWENSTNLCACAKRGIQVQHGAVHALTDVVSKGLMWCWKPLCCARRGLRPCWGLLCHDWRGPSWCWSKLESCGSTLAKDGTPQETFWG